MRNSRLGREDMAGNQSHHPVAHSLPLEQQTQKKKPGGGGDF